MLLSQALAQSAMKNGAKVAFKYYKQTLTYKDFFQTASRLSYYIQKELGHGHKVGLWMSNSPYMAMSLMALSNTRSLSVPLNPAASPDENLFKIKNAGINIIFTTTDCTKPVKQFLSDMHLNSIKVLEIEGKRAGEYDPSYTPPTNNQPVDTDGILLLYTPGTTGQYKGCLFNHKNVCHAANSLKLPYRMSPVDTFLTLQSFSFTQPLMQFLLAPLFAGSAVAITDNPNPADLIPLLVDVRVSHFAPQQLMQWFELLKFSMEQKMPLPPVRSVTFFNSTLTKQQIEISKKVMPNTALLQTYGMTEILGTICMNTMEFSADVARVGGCGAPLGGAKIRVLDDNNDEVDKKKPQRGQLAITTQALMTKYLELPDDQKHLVRGTWVFTGDMVDIDSEGRVTFLDRKADVVDVGTRKIFTKDVEKVLKTIPMIADAAYIGVKNRMKKPVAVAVLQKQENAKGLTEANVTEFLKSKLTGDKLPAAIIFVDNMPRTVSGAINRAKLRMLYEGI